MLTSEQIEQLRANPRFLVREFQRRGIDVSVFDSRNEVLEAKYGSHVEFLQDIDSSIVSYVGAILAGSKSITKALLTRAGISVPKGERFKVEDSELALKYVARRLQYPVVVKPSVGVQGKDVHTGIESEDELAVAIESIAQSRGECEILVEEHFDAREYRLFVTRTGEYAAVHRDPAHVIGDGVHTIAELAEQESFRRLNPRKNCLCAIVLDEESSVYLRKRGLTFRSKLLRGEKVYLRGSSNVMMGGVPEDVTDLVHPAFVEIGIRALTALNNLPYAGLDIMTGDISQPPTNYRLLEVNSVPGIGIHCAPGKGRPRNVPGMIADLIFPETATDKRFTSLAA